jgi:glycosyltransferase involved in cell wall biosynthesis
VYEAASFGLPVVATSLLRAQLGWHAGEEVLAADHADAEAFADHVLALYRDEALWQRVRDAALARIAADCAEAPYAERVRAILDSVRPRASTPRAARPAIIAAK